MIKTAIPIAIVIAKKSDHVIGWPQAENAEQRTI